MFLVFFHFDHIYQFHAYLSWFSVGSPSSGQQDCRGCSWGYRGPCWLALVTVTAGKNPKIHVIFEQESKSRISTTNQLTCAGLFLSKKITHAFWFKSVTYPIFFVTSRAPTEARLRTMETTAGCGGLQRPAARWPLLRQPLWIELHPVEGQAFLEICHCLTQQKNPFKKTAEHILPHIIISLSYMFLFYFVFIFVHS